VAPSNLRVNVVTPETIGSSHFVTIALPAFGQAVLFSDALQGAWVTTPTPLDTSRLSSIELHVHTDAAAPKPFDFCITNLRGIPW
jgi:hypothetical protein